MARNLLSGKISGATSLSQSTKPAEASGRLAERLRRVRSSAYIEAMAQLDSGGCIHDADRVARIRDAIAAEFPDGPASWPLGLVAKCYLGVPFEVHMVNITGEIIQHFRFGEAMPNGLDRARNLAASGQYAVIEVYSDRLVAIASNGTTSIAKF